jgi:hypothetical protein
LRRRRFETALHFAARSELPRAREHPVAPREAPPVRVHRLGLEAHPGDVHERRALHQAQLAVDAEVGDAPQLARLQDLAQVQLLLQHPHQHARLRARRGRLVGDDLEDRTVRAAVAAAVAALDLAAPWKEGRILRDRDVRAARAAQVGAEVVVRRAEDLAGVEDPFRIEEALDLLEDRIEVAPHPAHVGRAQEPVAVLPRERSAQLRHRAGRLLRDPRDLPVVLPVVGVHQQVDVDVAAAGVAEDHALDAVLPELLPQDADVVGELLRGDADVLDDARGAPHALHPLEDGRRRLADLREVREALPRGGPRLERLHLPHRLLGDRRRLAARLAVELHEQDGLRLRVQAPADQVLLHEVHDRAVQQLHRARPQRQELQHRLARRLRGREEEADRRLLGGPADHAELRLRDDGERPLRPGEEPAEVELVVAQDVPDVVAAGILGRARPGPLQKRALLLHEIADHREDLAVAPGVDGVAVLPHDARRLAVVEDDVEAEHVVAGRAVLHAVRARRVVGDHAAHRGDVAAGGVGGEPQAVPREPLVELPEHDARLDAHAGPDLVHLQDAVHVLREVEDDALAEGLPGEPAPRAARGDGDHPAVAVAHDARDVPRVPRHDDAERRDLEDAGGGGIEDAVDVVEEGLAPDPPSKVAPHGLRRTVHVSYLWPLNLRPPLWTVDCGLWTEG